MSNFSPPVRYWLWLVGLLAMSSVQAATFTVTKLDDSGQGSLRQAVLDANASLTANTIVFQSS